MSTTFSQTQEIIIDGTLRMAQNTLNEIDILIEDTLSMSQQEHRIAEAIDDEELYEIIFKLNELKSIKNDDIKHSIDYINKQISSIDEIIENRYSSSSDDENLQYFCTEISKNVRDNIDTNFNDLSSINSILDEFLYSEELKRADTAIQKQAHSIFDETIQKLSKAQRKHLDLEYLVELIEYFDMKGGQQ